MVPLRVSRFSRNVQPRIIGGENAEKGEIPWQVTIIVRSKCGYTHLCGGSIIRSRWVLTAAQCVSDPNPYRYTVFAGMTDLGETDGTAQQFRVSKVIQHENYNYCDQSHDVGLIKIDGSFSFNEYVSRIPLALPDINFRLEGVDTDCMASGFGVTDVGYPSESQFLKVVHLPLINSHECNEIYEWELGEDMICAGYEDGGKGVCWGDVGGPLACRIQGNWTLVGLTSWWFGDCANDRFPGVFARVSYFSTWITKHIDWEQKWTGVNYGG